MLANVLMFINLTTIPIVSRLVSIFKLFQPIELALKFVFFLGTGNNYEVPHLCHFI